MRPGPPRLRRHRPARPLLFLRFLGAHCYDPPERTKPSRPLGAGLYSPAFSLLGQLYGGSARSAITVLTLYGGFASTLCWPLSSLLVGQVGWHWTCLAYASAHLAVTLPLYVLALPRAVSAPAPTPPASASASASARGESAVSGRIPRRLIVVLVAGVATISTTVSTAMSVHMLTLLQALGLTAAAAVLLATAIGPSQVAARILEFLAGGRHHPLWTLLAATIAIALATTTMGLAAAASLPLIAAYGAGIGIASIGNGTAPLAVLGRDRYAHLMGRIAVPALVAQAAAPLLGGALIETLGEQGTLVALGGMAGVAALMILVLLRITGRGSRAT